jgi:hypothetical protein
MASQEFTSSALNRLRRIGAQVQYQTGDGSRPASKAEWNAFFIRLQNEILGDTFRFRGFQVRSLPGGKKMFSTKSLENIMVMRKINDNIRRAYRLKQASRYDVIAQIQQALRETVPKYVIRLDIKSFYESVPKRRLLNKLRADRIVSTRTIDLLDRLLRYTSHLGAKGVPRGLQVSSTLAELHASHLEMALRAIKGVYYVARYVDDIVLFSYVPADEIRDQIKHAFRDQGLVPNVEKQGGGHALNCSCAMQCVHRPLQCPCISKCKCRPEFTASGLRHIDILGYRLVFPAINARGKAKENQVRTYLADKKVSKYKQRIRSAVEDYSNTLDFELLLDRVSFLTGNYKLESTKVGGDLRGGIFYNFALYKPFDDLTLYESNRLEHLDGLLRAQLKRAFSFKRLPLSELRRMLAFSFANGHLRRRMRSFQPDRILEIGRCWNGS